MAGLHRRATVCFVHFVFPFGAWGRKKQGNEMIQQQKYDRAAMALHWLIAAMMIFMIFFGEDLMGEGGEERVASTGSFLPSLHVSLGTAIFALTIFRLIWRLMNPPPPLPAGMASWEITAAKITHGLFYVLTIGLPLTGWLAFPHFASEETARSAVSIFGMTPVPAAPDLGLPARGLHAIGSKVGMALVILHVLAALKHQFIYRDGLLMRMSPH